MKRAIVTGAGSMLASNLIRLLNDKGIEVLAIVRRGSLKKKNVPQSGLNEIKECDISELDSFEPSGRYDAFFHFAWAGTYGGARNDRALQERNVEGVLAAFRLAQRAGAEVFLTAGSQAEYGVKNVRLTAETELNPLTEYGRAKAQAAERVRLLAKKAGIAHVHMRILSVYGVGDNDFTMVKSAIRKMVNNEDTAFTAGTQIWDYLNAADAARAFYLAAEKKETAVYVLGSGTERSLREYIEIIADECGYKREIGFGKIPMGSLTYLAADIEPLRRLGFSPKVEFREGIREILKKEFHTAEE